MKPRKPMKRTELKRGDSQLKRTELKRGTSQLKRSPIKQRGSVVASPSDRPTPRPNGPTKTRKNTDPSKTVSDRVKARADIDGVPMCEVCGEAPGNNLHHRQPRGIGGCPLPYINEASNLLWVCGHGNAFPGCHAVIENDRDHAKADGVGWLVPRPALPIKVPVLRRGVLVLLDDEGGFAPHPRQTEEAA